jgi:hypothetical protein
VRLPIEDDARSALYLKAEEVTEAMDHGSFGLVAMSGGLQVLIESVGSA